MPYGTRYGTVGVAVTAVIHIGLQASKSRLQYTTAQMWDGGHRIIWWMNDRRHESQWLRVQDNGVFNSKSQVFNKWVTKHYKLGTGRAIKQFKCPAVYNWTAWINCVAELAQKWQKMPDLLTEAPLFTRQFANQLPELGESQLPVVVFIYWAHELVDHSRVAGILLMMTEALIITGPLRAETSAAVKGCPAT